MNELIDEVKLKRHTRGEQPVKRHNSQKPPSETNPLTRSLCFARVSSTLTSVAIAKIGFVLFGDFVGIVPVLHVTMNMTDRS